ncbi:transcriptional regulator, TetR family [Kaistia soli DSM 19436]|uniref:Transcriptional regulator, TetR family n=1 Tax=Kaistia soli DSM 19436 TaxID=1122133 RepID=A0A1M4W6L4_9HYPH|nr:transcriptional regulator, TetR family [Kaistia soli DSM 19436]
MDVISAEAELMVADQGAAGHDPRKRRQILDGARAVFLEKGFDAASMNDIARVAGVSKGTLYVYFEDKEHLFVELISTEKREELFSVIQLDLDNHDVAAVLTDCGTRLVEILTRPYYVRAMRTVFSIVNRMPEIGAEFYGRGPALCAEQIAAYLAVQVKAGVLEIEDCELAASQFMELAQTGVLRKLLFGIISTPDPDEIRQRVARAVSFFMKVYGKPATA